MTEHPAAPAVPESYKGDRHRPTMHSFEQVNWENAQQETRIGVLQEMVAILLNRLDEVIAERDAIADDEQAAVVEWARIEAEARATARKEVLDVERVADDVRWGYSKSEYSRGFNDGIDALIARLDSLSTDTREEPT